MLPAGNAPDFPLISAECEGIGHGAADAALVVAEGPDRPDPADQPALRALPNERDPVAELRKRKLKRFMRRDAVAPVARTGPPVFGNGSVFLSLEKGRGGRETQNGKCARPNDDRSVASERTHNQLVPPLRRGNHSIRPAPPTN